MEFSSPDNRCEPQDAEISRLVQLAAQGDEASLKTLLAFHDGRLRRMIALRVDDRISRRVDVDDVVQEVFIQASQHLPDYLRAPVAPFYLWLRGVAVNVMLELHRRHLGTQMRDARREVSLFRTGSPEASSSALAWHLADTGTSPSNAAMKAELKSQIEAALDDLPPADKEILALRHFEQLSPDETAAVLQVSKKAAGMRYLRALKRLRDELAETPGGLSQWRL